VAWGDAMFGGDGGRGYVQPEPSTPTLWDDPGIQEFNEQIAVGVKTVFPSFDFSSGAFAALKEDGHIVTWGAVEKQHNARELASSFLEA